VSTGIGARTGGALNECNQHGFCLVIAVSDAPSTGSDAEEDPALLPDLGRRLTDFARKHNICLRIEWHQGFFQIGG